MQRRLCPKKSTAVLAVLAVAGWLIVEEGCAVDDSTVKSGPVGHAGKPVATEFQADRTTDYDPLKGMSLEERKTAIGGTDHAVGYFKVIAAHMALAMKDLETRKLLSEAVPSWEDGEVELAKIAIASPHLLKTISAGIRESIEGKDLQDDLASKVAKSSFDEHALLQVAEALFDLEVVLVTPPGENWDPDKEIPVFFDPIRSGATLIEGFDSDLGRVSLSKDITEASEAFLAINFDEDSPLLDAPAQQASYQAPLPLDRLWNFSLVSPAYADRPIDHPECYRSNRLVPTEEITIWVDHDPGFWNKPEIREEFKWSQGNIGSHDFKLKKVDKVGKTYRNYDHLRTDHGNCGLYRNDIRIYEEDVLDDDEMARFNRKYITGRHEYREAGQVTLVVNISSDYR